MFNKTKRLEAILSSFTKVIDDLDQLKKSNLEAINQKVVVRDRINTQIEELETEGIHAMKVSEKLKSILS